MVHVQVGAMKIYVAAAEDALRKKERGGENRMKLSLPQKIGGFLGGFLNFTLVLVLCFPDFMKNSNV
jgi:hypothetical protein